MSEYRTTATLTSEGTFVVQAPKELPQGTTAEVIVRLDDPTPQSEPLHPLTAFLEELRLRPVAPEGTSRAEEAQAFLRDLRAEWN